jgi:hypothetical protein
VAGEAPRARQSGIVAAAERSVRHVKLRGVGEVAVPTADRLAFYAGIGVLAALGLIEWPVAAVIAGGHLLADQHMFSWLREVGEAAESA